MDLADIRIKEHFGLVTNDTNTTQFGFLVSPPKNRGTIEKHDLVCINHPKYGEACQVLAEVKEITSYEEVAGSTIGERVGKMLATAKVIGYVDLRNDTRPLQKLLAPPNPGSRVHVPYASFLEDTLNRGANGEAHTQTLYLGETEVDAPTQDAGDRRVGFYLDAADVTSRHTLICGMHGTGKTHLAGAIIREVASKTGYPVAVLDQNNEYASLCTASTLEKNRPYIFQVTAVNADLKNSASEITKQIRHGQVTPITAQNMSIAEKSSYYANILNNLAEARRTKNLQPFLLVIDDADSLPLQAIQEVFDANIGIGILLLSSHPTVLGGRVLSKIGTQIAGRTVDPQDLTFLRNVFEGSDVQLSSLRVGECVVNGLNVAFPMKIHVGERYLQKEMNG